MYYYSGLSCLRSVGKSTIKFEPFQNTLDVWMNHLIQKGMNPDSGYRLQMFFYKKTTVSGHFTLRKKD